MGGFGVAELTICCGAVLILIVTALGVGEPCEAGFAREGGPAPWRRIHLGGGEVGAT
jgi:hypothetical protein